MTPLQTAKLAWSSSLRHKVANPPQYHDIGALPKIQVEKEKGACKIHDNSARRMNIIISSSFVFAYYELYNICLVSSYLLLCRDGGVRRIEGYEIQNPTKNIRKQIKEKIYEANSCHGVSKS